MCFESSSSASYAPCWHIHTMYRMPEKERKERQIEVYQTWNKV